MARDTQIDALDFSKIEFPYNVIESQLSTTPRLVDGLNMWVTPGGVLAGRPGTINIAGGSYTKRCDRLICYETLDNPPLVYLVGSFYDSNTQTWEVRYVRLTGLPVWTAITSLRSINSSTAPHEFVVSRGLLFIKGFPSTGSGEKLGTVIWDGTGGAATTKPWGSLRPSTPIRIDGATGYLNADLGGTDSDVNMVMKAGSFTGFPVSYPFSVQVGQETIRVISLSGNTYTVNRGYNNTTIEEHPAGSLVLYLPWTASDHAVKVNYFWRYSFAYESSTGNVSSRSSYETNPDKLPSSTGPFKNLIPKMTVVTDSWANTTEYPYLRIYRTTDGGGEPYFLKRIANPGASNTFTFEDKYLLSGSSGTTEKDPVPDRDLDTARFGPSLTSNDPPPTVLAPGVVGTDTPVKATPIVWYAGRLWYGIGNFVFFSGAEEILEGIPEECWPSGSRGNAYRLQSQVTNLMPTSEALYVFTAAGTCYVVTGSNLQTFSIRLLFDNLGAPYGQPRAVTEFADKVALLSHDLRIVLIEGDQIRTISDPLGSEIVNAVVLGSASIDIKYFADKEKEYLVVSSYPGVDSATYRRVWIYDFKRSTEGRDFWFTPWSIRASACISSRIQESSTQRKLVWYAFSAPSGANGALVSWDDTGVLGTDYWFTGSEGYDKRATTGLFMVPSGNHVNELRKPALAPIVYGIHFERTLFNGDTDPEIFYYLDDFWTDPQPGEILDPARREPSKSYKSSFVPVSLAAYRVAVQWRKLNSRERFELQNFYLSWLPDSGAGEA